MSVCFVRLVVLPYAGDANHAKCQVKLPDIYIKNFSSDEPTMLIFRIAGSSSYSFDGNSVTINTGTGGTTEDKNFDRSVGQTLGSRFYVLINSVRYADNFVYDVQIKSASETNYCKTSDPVIHNQN
jgi:hypothetical protein